METDIKNYEKSKKNIEKEINDSKSEQKKLEDQLLEEQEKLEKTLKEQKNLIGLNDEKKIKLNQSQNENNIIEDIKKKIEKQIDDKKKEKDTKIPGKPILEDDKDHINLICYHCKETCHPDCRCMPIFVWKPVFACKKIDIAIFKQSVCSSCKCPKNEHDRIKKRYKTPYVPLPEEKKKILDDEIGKLQKCLDDISSIEEKQSSVNVKRKEIADKQTKVDEYNSNIASTEKVKDNLIDSLKDKDLLIKQSKLNEENEQNKIDYLKGQKDQKDKAEINKKELDDEIKKKKEELLEEKE